MRKTKARSHTRAHAKKLPLKGIAYPAVSVAAVILVALASMVLAQEEQPQQESVDSIEASGTEQVAVTGALVSGDVLGEDNSEIILASDPDEGMTSVVSGDLTANDNNEVSGDIIHVKGNVTASDNSRVKLTQSIVDGNVTMYDDGEVFIDAGTVVQGDIEGVLLRTENGYNVYGAYPTQ